MDTLDTQERGALTNSAKIAKARAGLLPFCKRMYPGFQDPPHIKLLAGLLEQAARERRKRIMINVSVRHGKSVLCSQLFPAWYIGNNPYNNVILASHSQDLAERNSRVAKSMLLDPKWPFRTKLSKDSMAAGRWNTDNGLGGCYAVGVGGSITGRGMNVGVVDDALHDGLSEVERESAWRWFSEVFVPRLEPGAAIVNVGARFADDDLCGRILDSEDGPNWTVIRLPAIAEENDPLGRLPGEALWPERFDVAELQSRRVQMGSRAFDAQFQQRPQSSEGNRFKRAWFEQRYEGGFPRTYVTEPCGEISPGVYDSYSTWEEPSWTCLAIDCASKTGAMNDYSALVTLATNGVNCYVVDVVRERLEFSDLLRRVQEVYHKWGPQRIYIESASSGIAIEQEIRRSTNLPVIGVPATMKKEARATAIEPLFESGRVFLPQGAPWIDMFVDEFAAFPNGRHDDMVDATVLGLSKIGEIADLHYANQESPFRTLDFDLLQT